MRILIFTNHFFPENFKVNDIAFELAAKGHKVSVVTGIPNYPTGVFYKGYGFFKKNFEELDGVKIYRMPLIPRGSGSPFRLLINYFTYLISSSIFSLYLCFRKFDHVLVHETSPVTVGIPAVIYSAIRKTPLFFWVLDLWPESVEATTNIKNRYILGLFNRLVRYLYKRSDKILMSSRGFEESILEKGDFKRKLVYFPNWAEDIFFQQPLPLPAEFGLQPIVFPQGFKIMYAGNIGEAQDFDNILQAAKILKDYPDIKWIFVGGGRKQGEIESFIKAHGLSASFLLPGNYPNKLMPYCFSNADLMIVSLKDDLIFKITVPAKLQAYMGFGKPVLGILNGEGAKIIEEADCGVVCPPNNPEKLANTVLSLYNLATTELKEKGVNGLNYYHSNFGKARNLELLLELFENHQIK